MGKVVETNKKKSVKFLCEYELKADEVKRRQWNEGGGVKGGGL